MGLRVGYGGSEPKPVQFFHSLPVIGVDRHGVRLDSVARVELVVHGKPPLACGLTG